MIRTGGGCCCRCMWLNQDWPDLPTPHVDSVMVDTNTESVSLISDDGSSIGCRKSALVFDFKRVDKQTPCIEFTFDLAFDVSPLPPISYQSQYFIGQTFSDFEFVPDGKSHTLSGTIDSAFRYREVHLVEGDLWLPIIDADVPTSPFQVPGNPPALYAEQDGHHYSIGFNGGSSFAFPDSVTGDWGRWTTLTAASEPRLMSTMLWQEVGPRVIDYNGRLSMFSGGQPDLTDGAPPIYFGWCYYLNAEQQFLPLSPGGMPLDLRFTQWKETIRLDRFCLTIR